MNSRLNSRYKKASSFLTRLRCIGGAAGLALQRDFRPRVRRTNTTPATGLNSRYKKAPSLLTRLRCVGGTAGLAFHWAGTPAGLSTPCQAHQYNSSNRLKFQMQKSPSISAEASLCWRSGRDSNPRPPA